MSSDYYGNIAGERFYEVPGSRLQELRDAAAERDQAVKLLEAALFLRQNGERPPGGNETWRDWERDAEQFLRGLLPAAATGERIEP